MITDQAHLARNARRKPSRGIRLSRCLAVAVLVGTVFSHGHAATWVAGSGNFTNPASWSGGIVPGPADDAIFTNGGSYTVTWTADATNANAFVNTPGIGTTTLGVGSQMWWLTNQFILGQTLGTTGTVHHTTGTIVVTNADGTGSLIVGQAGRGIYSLGGGTLTVDQLYVTNGASSTLNLNTGTLTVQNGMLVSATGNMGIGNSGTMTLNLLGGTNTLASTGRINLGGNATGRALVTVSGPGTLWSNAATTFYVGGAGHRSELVISNQARVISPNSTVGEFLFSSNLVTVTGSGSIWDTAALVVGFRANTGNQLLVTDGGLVRSTAGTIGSVTDATSNSVVVTGADSAWQMTGDLIVGSGGASNAMTIADGGVVSNALGYIGYGTGQRNAVLVTGEDSRWVSSGNLTVGRQGVGSSLVVSNGALVWSSDGAIGSTSLGTSNSVLVTGSGSRWFATNGLFVGQNSTGNSLTIAEGGVVSNSSAIIGLAATGNSAISNRVLVTDEGSRWLIAGDLTLGQTPVSGTGNSLTISNGGFVSGVNAIVGLNVVASNNQVLVTGPGSIWQNTGLVAVGSNASTKGFGGLIRVEDGATLEANTLVSGFLVGGVASGIISNSGGIYQFTTATPTITTNSADSIVLNNGTISFRGVANANVLGNAIGASSNQLVKMTFLGDNAFRLNGSSNATGLSAYSFATGTATNYSALELVNDTTLWRSATLTVGSTGRLLASNTTATVAAAVTADGSITVVNSHMTFTSNVVLSGSYVSDPSTNTFLADLTIDPSGSLAGGTGNLFDFKQNFLIHSTNKTSFDLIQSTVQFSGGGVHTNLITGEDFGTNGVYGGNFEYGTLRLGSTNNIVCFGCGNLPSVTSNALYVNWLDLDDDTNLIANLRAPMSINLYYALFDSRNDYLGGQTYQLLDCEGNLGGLLLAAIPEPSALTLFVVAGCAMLGRRSKGR